MRDIKSLVGVTRNKIGFDEEMEVDLWVQSPCLLNISNEFRCPTKQTTTTTLKAKRQLLSPATVEKREYSMTLPEAFISVLWIKDETASEV